MTRKRSKYRPKNINTKAHRIVLDRLIPIRENTQAMLAQKAMNHLAIARICKGEGDLGDVKALINALNVSAALATVAPRLGSAWLQEIREALGFLCDMTERGVKAGDRFIFKAQELTSINLAMEIHDAQLDSCIGIEMEAAILFTRRAHELGALKQLPRSRYG